MLDSLAAAGGQVPLRLTTTLFLAAAVYCALMGVTLKISATMVAGWRLPFGASRERKTSNTSVEAVPGQSQVPAVGLEPAAATAGNSDPRVRAIISAASGGAASYDRAPAPTYPLYSSASQTADATASPAPAPRTDPRLGSLSRQYRPRNMQFQRTSS
jgi:hypothetical protein